MGIQGPPPSAPPPSKGKCPCVLLHRVVAKWVGPTPGMPWDQPLPRPFQGASQFRCTCFQLPPTALWPFCDSWCVRAPLHLQHRHNVAALLQPLQYAVQSPTPSFGKGLPRVVLSTAFLRA